MLREKTIGLNIVCIDLKSILDIVFTVLDKATDVMVCSPEPSMVDDYVLVIDFNHALGTNF